MNIWFQPFRSSVCGIKMEAAIFLKFFVDCLVFDQSDNLNHLRFEFLKCYWLLKCDLVTYFCFVSECLVF